MEGSMSHFYGTVEGKSGSVASRTGSKASGLEVSAKSWEGEVQIKLSHTAEGRDYIEIWAGPHGDPRWLIFNGPVALLASGNAVVTRDEEFA